MDTLPNEMIAYIGTFLGANSICNLSATNSSYYNVLTEIRMKWRHKVLLRKLHLELYELRTKSKTNYCDYYMNIQSTSIGLVLRTLDKKDIVSKCNMGVVDYMNCLSCMREKKYGFIYDILYNYQMYTVCHT
jgi:hypothetical protein